MVFTKETPPPKDTFLRMYHNWVGKGEENGGGEENRGGEERNEKGIKEGRRV
jgi:hypothetical protein